MGLVPVRMAAAAKMPVANRRAQTFSCVGMQPPSQSHLGSLEFGEISICCQDAQSFCRLGVFGRPALVATNRLRESRTLLQSLS